MIPRIVRIDGVKTPANVPSEAPDCGFLRLIAGCVMRSVSTDPGKSVWTDDGGVSRDHVPGTRKESSAPSSAALLRLRLRRQAAVMSSPCAVNAQITAIEMAMKMMPQIGYHGSHAKATRPARTAMITPTTRAHIWAEKT